MNMQAEDSHRSIDDFIAGLALDCSAAQQALHASVRADRANFLARARRLPPRLRDIVKPFAPAYQCIANFEIETRFDVVQSRGLRGRLELEPLNAYYTRAKRRDVTSASRVVVEIKYNPPGTGK